MSATTTARPWRLVERATCTICESEGEVADTGLELADGTRVRVCGDCTVALVATLKLESTASQALSAAHLRELAAREEMLASRDVALGRLREQLESQQVANERLLAEAERRSVAIATIKAAVLELG
jgi:hypothetical protein